MDNSKRVCLWSGPRNVSTALMYSFAQRSDCKVYDEPLYAYYLSQTRAKEYHPGTDDILASMENDGEKVVEMMMGPHAKPVVFFKNMTHHLLDLDKSFMSDVTNVLLTRDPSAMIPSFAKVIKNPTMTDLGYAMHGKLLDYFEAQGIEPLVLDSGNILKNPEDILSQLCEKIGIPFKKAMLSWKPGPISEDGVWAKYWYESIHKSSGFQPYQEKKSTDIEGSLLPLLKESKKYYQRLSALAIS